MITFFLITLYCVLLSLLLSAVFYITDITTGLWLRVPVPRISFFLFSIIYFYSFFLVLATCSLLINNNISNTFFTVATSGIVILVYYYIMTMHHSMVHNVISLMDKKYEHYSGFFYFGQHFALFYFILFMIDEGWIGHLDWLYRLLPFT